MTSRRRVFVAIALISMCVLSACGNPAENARTTTPQTPTANDTAIATSTPLPAATQAVPQPVDMRTVVAEEMRKGAATRTVLAGTTRIYRYVIATRTLAKISTARAHTLAWLPDGETIWYSTTLHPNGSGEIRRLNLRTGEGSAIFSLVGGWADLSPATGRVAFSSFRSQSPTTFEGYSVRLFDEARGLVDFGEGVHLGLSPDGSMLSYVTPSCGEEPKLKVIDLTRGVPLAIPDIAISRAWWMPDRRIALILAGATSIEEAQWRILDPSTGGMTSLRDLVGDGVFSDPAFSPDMKHVVLTLDRPDGHVVVRDIITGSETQVSVEPLGSSVEPLCLFGSRLAYHRVE